MIRFIRADIRSMPAAVVALVILIMLATAPGVLVTLGERAVRLGSARAADRFDIVIGAAGSPAQLLLSTVFLQPAALPLVPGSVLERLQKDKRVVFAAPLGFGDSYQDYSIIGTTLPLITHLYGGVQQGRLFLRENEAVIGTGVKLDIGQTVDPLHGAPGGGGHHHEQVSYRIVGRLAESGTVWDRAILVPMAGVWRIHGLKPPGHGLTPPGHSHEASALPENASQTPGASGASHAAAVPAIVVKSRTIADAYRLRQEYSTPATLAVFPAEVLTGLYATLGDVHIMFAVMAFCMQALVAGCIAFVAILHIQLRRRQIAALRILGISRFRILAIVWFELFVLLLCGLGFGYLSGFALMAVIKGLTAQTTGIILFIEWQERDGYVLSACVAIAAMLCLVPAVLAARRRPVADIRG